MYLLKPAHIQQAFPFHLVLDKALNICQIGHSLKKVAPSITIGAHFFDHFEIKRPRITSIWGNQERLSRAACQVQCLQNAMVLKYEALFDEEEGLIFLIGSPQIKNERSLANYGLKLHDFARHDATPDLYLASKPKDRLIKEKQLLTDKLKTSQKELELLASQLELKVIERTRELEKAKILAEEANQAKSIFLARMTHELRTPLNGVIGMSSLMSETEMSADQKEYIETIINSGESLLNLVNEILDIAKIESDEFELEYIPLELGTLIQEALHIVNIKALNKNLKVRCKIEGDPPVIYLGDPGRIKQIVLNLLSNAVKFTENGYVEIIYAAKRIKKHQYAVSLSVKDTGIGIPNRKIHSLFDKFTQVDSSTTRKYGGTGLGLSITQELAQAMGGSIHVESKEGVGSVFTVELRLDTPPAIPVSFRQQLPAQLAGSSVMLFDADPLDRELTTCIFQKAGLQTTAFAELQDLKQVLLQTPPDFIVLDHHSIGARNMFIYGQHLAHMANRSAIILKPHGLTLTQSLANYAVLTKPLFLKDVIALFKSIASREGKNAGLPWDVQRLSR